MPSTTISDSLIRATKRLSKQLAKLQFDEPITHVYNPLDYAWKAHQQYIERYASTQKKVVFLGMNPGPFGMMQTSVPFGEIEIVRDWIKIQDGVSQPSQQHSKRPIEGFDCQRSEVSGRRLWGLFKDRYGTARSFFKDHYVANYCPLAFLEESGRNFTPDKLPSATAKQLQLHCDEHLRTVIKTLEPDWLIGIGAFAKKRATIALENVSIQIGQVLHPSPASPAANRGWAQQAQKQLCDLGIWKSE